MTAAIDRADVVDRLDETAVQAIYRALGVARFASGGPGDWLVSSPLRDDRRPSFTIRRADGVWRDHATGASGSVFDAVMLARGCAFPEALAFVAEHAGYRPMAPATTATRAGRGRVVATYDYRDESGALLYQVVRVDP
ncbi:MAG TPA: hypothetical protein PKA95_17785, partial [Thermomicrobiales bacterium]|nr:hypothetical protein [Thermomicrobiales bacterium]